MLLQDLNNKENKMEEWKLKIWEKETAVDYVASLPAADIWSLPLEDWIYHSVAECVVLFTALLNKDPKCSEGILISYEGEKLFRQAITSLKKTYVMDFKDFAEYRLLNKINDLLLLSSSFNDILGKDALMWQTIVENIAEEIEDEGIFDPGDIKYNFTKYAIN